MNRMMLFLSLAWAIALYVLHSLAVEHSLYWMIWWYDIPMHLIGGALLGGFLGWFFFSLGQRFPKTIFSHWMIFSLSVVFLGGVAWEIFEYFFNLFYHPYISYSLDTAKDLLMDMIGALLVTWPYRKKQIFTQSLS